MIKNILAVLAFGWCMACGAADEGDLFDDSQLADGGDEIGQAEQGLVSKEGPSFEYGVQTATARNKCSRTSTTQVCSVPSTKVWQYCPQGEPYNSFSQTLKSAISKMMPQVGSWSSFDFVSVPLDIFGVCVPGQQNLSFSVGAVGSSGTGSNTITDYVKFDPANTASTNETAGVTGQRLVSGSCVCKIDETDILAKGPTSTQDRNIMEHAVAACLAMCGGVGLNSWGSTSTNYTRKEVNGLQAVTTLTSGEICMMDGYQTTNPGTYDENLTDCPND